MIHVVARTLKHEPHAKLQASQKPHVLRTAHLLEHPWVHGTLPKLSCYINQVTEGMHQGRHA